MRDKFDLVICFVGSAACNPFLEHLLTENWDPRFFFSEWDPDLISKLLRQQEELLAAGIKREVLILSDDVILNSKADDQLAHLSMRGRHFRISLMMCAVSYTSLPKRMRRSLDCMLLFSVPMRGDLLLLTSEYCTNNARVARHVLNQLRDHECLVLETLMKKQELFTWKADLLTVETPQNESLQDHDESQNGHGVVSPKASLDDHQSKIGAPLNSNELTGDSSDS